jgi:hypothetical protein
VREKDLTHAAPADPIDHAVTADELADRRAVAFTLVALAAGFEGSAFHEPLGLGAFVGAEQAINGPSQLRVRGARAFDESIPFLGWKVQRRLEDVVHPVSSLARHPGSRARERLVEPGPGVPPVALDGGG